MKGKSKFKFLCNKFGESNVESNQQSFKDQNHKGINNLKQRTTPCKLECRITYSGNSVSKSKPRLDDNSRRKSKSPALKSARKSSNSIEKKPLFSTYSKLGKTKKQFNTTFISKPSVLTEGTLYTNAIDFTKVSINITKTETFSISPRKRNTNVPLFSSDNQFELKLILSGIRNFLREINSCNELEKEKLISSCIEYFREKKIFLSILDGEASQLKNVMLNPLESELSVYKDTWNLVLELFKYLNLNSKSLNNLNIDNPDHENYLNNFQQEYIPSHKVKKQILKGKSNICNDSAEEIAEKKLKHLYIDKDSTNTFKNTSNGEISKNGASTDCQIVNHNYDIPITISSAIDKKDKGSFIRDESASLNDLISSEETFAYNNENDSKKISTEIEFKKGKEQKESALALSSTEKNLNDIYLDAMLKTLDSSSKQGGKTSIFETQQNPFIINDKDIKMNGDLIVPIYKENIVCSTPLNSRYNNRYNSYLKSQKSTSNNKTSDSIYLSCVDFKDLEGYKFDQNKHNLKVSQIKPQFEKGYNEKNFADEDSKKNNDDEIIDQVAELECSSILSNCTSGRKASIEAKSRQVSDIKFPIDIFSGSLIKNKNSILSSLSSNGKSNQFHINSAYESKTGKSNLNCKMDFSLCKSEISKSIKNQFEESFKSNGNNITK